MTKIRKLKILLPTLREKKHYLVVTVNAEDKKEAVKMVDNSVLDYIGVLGYAKASPVFVDFIKEKGKAIMAVNRKYVVDVKAALLFSGLKCVGVSGTIKKAREKFM